LSEGSDLTGGPTGELLVARTKGEEVPPNTGRSTAPERGFPIFNIKVYEKDKLIILQDPQMRVSVPANLLQ
jgi:hypothetical protein